MNSIRISAFIDGNLWSQIQPETDANLSEKEYRFETQRNLHASLPRGNALYQKSSWVNKERKM